MIIREDRVGVQPGAGGGAISIMPSEFDIRPMVEKYSALPPGRFKIINRFEDIGASGMVRGIVFVFAAWSGPAVAGFRAFSKIMNELPTEPLDLIVFDFDNLTNESAAWLFGTDGFRAGGYGETIWIRDGRIVAREWASSESMVRDHTLELLG